MQPQYAKRILYNQFWTLIKKCQKIILVDFLVLREEKWDTRGNKEQIAGTALNLGTVVWNSMLFLWLSFPTAELIKDTDY